MLTLIITVMFTFLTIGDPFSPEGGGAEQMRASAPIPVRHPALPGQFIFAANEDPISILNLLEFGNETPLKTAPYFDQEREEGDSQWFPGTFDAPPQIILDHLTGKKFRITIDIDTAWGNHHDAFEMEKGQSRSTTTGAGGEVISETLPAPDEPFLDQLFHHGGGATTPFRHPSWSLLCRAGFDPDKGGYSPDAWGLLGSGFVDLAPLIFLQFQWGTYNSYLGYDGMGKRWRSPLIARARVFESFEPAEGADEDAEPRPPEVRAAWECSPLIITPGSSGFPVDSTPPDDLPPFARQPIFTFEALEHIDDFLSFERA